MELEREREMVNPERIWSGVIIKCSERGGKIVDAPLCSNRLLCRIPPHKCGFLLMTVLLQDLTQSNRSLPVTKDTVTVCQVIVVVFFIN